MLRKGIVALMITVMSVSAGTADDKSTQGLMGLLRGPSMGRSDTKTKNRAPQHGIRHAVVADVEREVPEVRQVAMRPAPPQLKPADNVPRPIEVSAMPQGQVLPMYSAGNSQHYAPQPVGLPVQTVSGHRILPNSYSYGRGVGAGNHHLPIVTNPIGLSGPAGALYPSPKPGIPHQVGGTSIVHHALHPHEMTYPHRYKAMYGPYYYKVKGGWVVTPFGVWSKENWKLQGTQVDVKYKSHISPFAMFTPPFIR